jgi:fatty-acyl-CoA synthase
MQVVDRTKDLIKSGGLWISSVALENQLMAHPNVVEAAVIAEPHDKWGERPVAVVVLAEGKKVSPSDLRDFIAPHFPRWCLPDRFEFVEELPKTGVGKFLKRTLREQFATA